MRLIFLSIGSCVKFVGRGLKGDAVQEMLIWMKEYANISEGQWHLVFQAGLIDFIPLAKRYIGEFDCTSLEGGSLKALANEINILRAQHPTTNFLIFAEEGNVTNLPSYPGLLPPGQKAVLRGEDIDNFPFGSGLIGIADADGVVFRSVHK